MLQRCLIIAFALLLPWSLWAEGPVYRLNLAQCVALALRSNDMIRSSDYNEDLAQARMDEAHPRSIPQVNYQYRFAPVPKNTDDVFKSFGQGEITVLNSLKIDAISPLSTFGKINTAQQLAQIGINSSGHEKQRTTNDVVLKVHELYHGVLLSRELIELASQAQNTLEQKIEQLKKDVVQDQLQILNLKVALYEVQRRVEEARQKGELAMAALKLQLGLESDADFDIVDHELKPEIFKVENFESYVNLAKAYRPEYKLLEDGVKALEKKVKLEKVNYAPNLGAGAFFEIARTPDVSGTQFLNAYTNTFNYTRGGVGVQLQGQLDFIKTGSKIKQAQAELLSTIYKKRAAVKALDLEVKNDYLSLLQAKVLMEKAGEEKKAAQQMVFLTKSNLDIGVGERKDYLDALQFYLVFQARQFEAFYYFNVAVSRLKSRVGMLNPEGVKQ